MIVHASLVCDFESAIVDGQTSIVRHPHVDGGWKVLHHGTRRRIDEVPVVVPCRSVRNINREGPKVCDKGTCGRTRAKYGTRIPSRTSEEIDWFKEC